MSPAASPSIVRINGVLARPVATVANPKTSLTSRRGSHPNISAVSSWAKWEANGPLSSGNEFLESVSSWLEGTTAQLLRQAWPSGTRRPTSIEVRELLDHHLGIVAAQDGHVPYIEALALARSGVIEDLRRARGLGPTS